MSSLPDKLRLVRARSGLVDRMVCEYLSPTGPARADDLPDKPAFY